MTFIQYSLSTFVLCCVVFWCSVLIARIQRFLTFLVEGLRGFIRAIAVHVRVLQAESLGVMSRCGIDAPTVDQLTAIVNGGRHVDQVNCSGGVPTTPHVIERVYRWLVQHLLFRLINGSFIQAAAIIRDIFTAVCITDDTQLLLLMLLMMLLLVLLGYQLVVRCQV